ncbi:MAG: ABC transporter permease [Chloroflexi bacterium]|nr:ABC transporter permease [Chloroflexota bacterium]MBI4198379.1 ABC transporter permease [Chloroflexota bacterium]
MQKYIIQRLMLAVPTLLLASLVIFSLVRILPGDVIMATLSDQSQTISPERLAQMRHQLGLDKPFITQYLSWLGGAVRGDLGKSLWAQRPATQELLKALPVTAQLGVMGLIIGWLIGIPVGVISAIRQDKPVDYVGRVISILGVAVPDFWIATIIILVLSLWFNYLPPLGSAVIWQDPAKSLQQFAWPALILGFRLSAVIMRMTRSTMLEVIRQDYIRTARAKGLSEQMVIYRHALKNAMIPVVTIVGAQVGIIVGGAVILETIFALPGVGRLTFQSITLRDYPQIQANILVIATLIVFMNLVVDLAYAWLDPRIRYG